MKRLIKKIVVSTLVVLVVSISGLITIVFFPQPLFAKSMEHKNFRIYSNAEVDMAFCAILDNAFSLVESCELNDSNYQFKVFISHDNVFNTIEDLQGRGPIARVTAGNIILKVPVDVGRNQAIGLRSTVNLTELLAHEMVHCLQVNKYGFLNHTPWNHPPYWKLEGYPEYVSRQNLLKDPQYNLATEIERFIDLEKASIDGFVEVTPGHFVPSVYYKGRLMMEYLMDIKGMTYEEILYDNRTENEIFHSMVVSLGIRLG